MPETRSGHFEPAPRPGRPRDFGAQRKIFDATLFLLQSNSIKDITIEGIAREAGVSKVTIYRWWDSKAKLLVDAFTDAHLIKTPMQNSLPPGQRIAKHFLMMAQQFSGWPGRVVSQIIGEGQSDPDMLRDFRERFHYGRRGAVREVMDEWRQRGEIPPDFSSEYLMDVIYAPVYMRLLMGHAPLDRDFAESHLTSVYRMLGASPPDFSAL
jgi:AcrR family transcriptional regulator